MSQAHPRDERDPAQSGKRTDHAQKCTHSGNYPIFPNEIMAEIFMHALQSRSDRRPRVDQFPLLPLLVCKHWRAIALANHRLWTTLDLFAEELLKLFPARRIGNFADAWFQWAGILPVALAFFGPDDLDNDLDSSDLRDIIEPVAARLHSLTLEIGITHLDRENLAFPLLEKLEVRDLWGWQENQTERRWNTSFRYCGTAPRLREAILQMPANALLFIHPSATLTKFIGEYMTANDCLTFLRASPSLVECSTTLDLTDPLHDHLMVTMHHLKTLRLTRSPPSRSYDVEHAAVANMLELLDAPALEHLEIGNVPDLERFDTEMATFFSRVSASLRHLSFSSTAPLTEIYPYSYGVQWFTQLAQLTHVEFTSPTEDFLTPFFAKLKESRDFLAELKSLRIFQYEYILKDAFVHALRSRTTEGTGRQVALEAFQVVWSADGERHAHRIDLAELASLERRRMRLHIGSKSMDCLIRHIARMKSIPKLP
ncbi:hypothetical protein FB45DRAFT_426455 [Roridomyces roridus]|uniref:F-box domain-containing protein n=1 Tax=Roridomyces roridus TaxID=1738132 RepID=A0AAD7C5W6_9AGAR|nr:hypothetical protein FB45DRAFT_426455 [Roridomyces roridus]